MGAAVVAFSIPEEIGGVLRWFMGALGPLSGVRYRESQGVGLFLKEPKEENPREPGVVTDIVIPACRVKAIPILSDWGLTRDWKPEEEPLEPVMRFRFAILGGETYVMASCDARLSPAQNDFLAFLKQIQARFPAVGPFWQEYETELRERQKEHLKRGFGDAGRAAVAANEGEPGTGAEAAQEPM